MTENPFGFASDVENELGKGTAPVATKPLIYIRLQSDANGIGTNQNKTKSRDTAGFSQFRQKHRTTGKPIGLNASYTHKMSIRRAKHHKLRQIRRKAHRKGQSVHKFASRFVLYAQNIVGRNRKSQRQTYDITRFRLVYIVFPQRNRARVNPHLFRKLRLGESIEHAKLLYAISKAHYEHYTAVLPESKAPTPTPAPPAEQKNKISAPVRHPFRNFFTLLGTLDFGVFQTYFDRFFRIFTEERIITTIRKTQLLRIESEKMRLLKA